MGLLTSALTDLGEDAVAASLRAGEQIDLKDFMSRRLLKWPVLDPDIRHPHVLTRRQTTYFQWFNPGKQPPKYLADAALTMRQKYNISRFRLNPHHLGVLANRSVPWEDRTCGRCSVQRFAALPCAVDDEYHVLFDCSAFDSLRAGVADLIPANSVDRQRRFPSLFNEPSFCRFVSATMSHLAHEGKACRPSAAEQPDG